MKWKMNRIGPAYHSLLPLMKPREVHRQTKIKPYETLTRSVLWYEKRCGHCSRLRKKCLMHLRGSSGKSMDLCCLMDRCQTDIITKCINYSKRGWYTRQKQNLGREKSIHVFCNKEESKQYLHNPIWKHIQIYIFLQHCKLCSLQSSWNIMIRENISSALFRTLRDTSS